jgi:excinuclease ABC subunit C
MTRSDLAFDPEPLLEKLTQRPGVYRMLDEQGTVIYAGKARNLRRRVSSYFRGRAHDAKTIAMLRSVASIDVTVTRTETEALMLEYNLIKQHKPRFNVVLRDDKSYPYIHLSVEQAFPRISFYRGARKTKGRLFGPYPSAGAVRGTIGELQKLFRIRGCTDSYFSNRTRPCLQYQIERCTAPCVDLISEEEYRRDVENAVLFLEGKSDAVSERIAERMEAAAENLQFERAAVYRDQLAELNRIQTQQLMAKGHGDYDVIAAVREEGVCCVAVMFLRGGRSLGSRNYFPRNTQGASDDEIVRAFMLQFYGDRLAPREILVNREVPDAALLAEMLSDKAERKVLIKWRLRSDRARWVEMAETNARHGAQLRSREGATRVQQLEALGALLGLDEPPTRLECFDISHTGGSATVASCVVFGTEGPIKSDYRRFNIRDVTAGDDYGAMRQALTRRYAKVKRAEAPIPDVLIIDGGRGQLTQATRVLEDLGLDDICVLAVAKGEGRKPGRETLFVAGGERALRPGGHAAELQMIQQIRDEAHRFAIMGHRARRQKRLTKSPLEDIRGLGPKRRRDLLRQFGGLQAVARAGIDDLTRVKGISRQLARSIYDRFHSN